VSLRPFLNLKSQFLNLKFQISNLRLLFTIELFYLLDERRIILRLGTAFVSGGKIEQFYKILQLRRSSLSAEIAAGDNPANNRRAVIVSLLAPGIYIFQ